MTFEEKLKKYNFEYRLENNKIILKNTFTKIEYTFNHISQAEYVLDYFENNLNSFLSNVHEVKIQYEDDVYSKFTCYPGPITFFIMHDSTKLKITNIGDIARMVYSRS